MDFDEPACETTWSKFVDLVSVFFFFFFFFRSCKFLSFKFPSGMCRFWFGSGIFFQSMYYYIILFYIMLLNAIHELAHRSASG